MKRIIIVLTTLFFVFSCSTVPVTGRKQVAWIPSSQLLGLSFNSYQEVLKESKLSNNSAQAASIKRVGERISKAVEEYMRSINKSSSLDGYKWEFNLLEGKEVNAWCMPGGKVAFYEGIMPVTQDDQGIAVVMGHEVAHAVAEHGNERMTQGLIQQGLGTGLAVALSEKPQETQALAMTAFGVGSTVLGVLPYSRLHESEADRMGLIFMAMAGYDPRTAPEFWKRMQAKGGSTPPEFLSTHPAPSTRIKDLEKHMNDAMKYYKSK